MKRLGIFVFFDEEGIVDDYVYYLLGDLLPNLSELIIIVNGLLQPGQEEKLRPLCGKILRRENHGFDAEAFKFVLTRHLKRKQLEEFDELVFLNDSFFGPFYPFGRIFADMDARKVDFWGLTCHYETANVFGNCPYGYIPAHLQSYFLVIRRSMFQSAAFWEYWEALPDFSSFEDVVGRHEAVFTRYFEERGFAWEAYVDTSYSASGEISQNYNTYAIDPYYLLSARKMPVLKRKNFSFPLADCLTYSRGDEFSLSMTYLKENTDYDTDLIWQNILRKYNLADIFDSLGLQYVLPNDFVTGSRTLPRTLAAFHIYYAEEAEALSPYIRALPEEVDVLVTTTDEEKRNRIAKAWAGRPLRFLLVPERGRDISALLMAVGKIAWNYEFLCFCHDKKSARYPLPVGRDFQRLLWENLLASREYIFNVLELFRKEKRLGLAVPPAPFHGGYRALLGDRWTVNYQRTEQLLRQMGLRANIQRDKPPLTLGTAFWCRTEALRKLWEYPWAEEMFPAEPLTSDGEINHALERCLGYVAQDAGFYTAWIMTPREAALEARNSRHMLEGTVQKLDRESLADGFSQMIIYGAGNWGQMAFERYQGRCEILFFADSNESKQRGKKCGRRICPPEEIAAHREAVVMVAVEKAEGIVEYLKGNFDNKVLVFHPWGSTTAED